MRPQPRSIMPSITCLVTWNSELRLVSMTACQASLLIFWNVPSRVMPALLTRMSIGPISARALSKARLVESQSETLPSEACTLKPSARISASHRSLRVEPGPQPAMTV